MFDDISSRYHSYLIWVFLLWAEVDDNGVVGDYQIFWDIINFIMWHKKNIVSSFHDSFSCRLVPICRIPFQKRWSIISLFLGRCLVSCIVWWFCQCMAELIQLLKHEWMSHSVICTFILKLKHPPIELQPQNGLLYPGIELNLKTVQ